MRMCELHIRQPTGSSPRTGNTSPQISQNDTEGELTHSNGWQYEQTIYIFTHIQPKPINNLVTSHTQ